MKFLIRGLIREVTRVLVFTRYGHWLLGALTLLVLVLVVGHQWRRRAE
jgi:putative copper export protein